MHALIHICTRSFLSLSALETIVVVVVCGVFQSKKGMERRGAKIDACRGQGLGQGISAREQGLLGQRLSARGQGLGLEYTVATVVGVDGDGGGCGLHPPPATITTTVTVTVTVTATSTVTI